MLNRFLAALALAGALLCASCHADEAYAHDAWANGEPVPAWVKRACCGQEDVHHLRAEQVHLQQDGFHVDGLSTVVPYSKALPSPDGEYWGFWHTFSDGSTSNPYCFFAGSQGS